MRKQMIENAALEVANQVRAVEDIIEDALGEIAELQSRMVRARATMGVSTATGHAAFEQLAMAVQGLVAARGGMAQCHGVLKETQRFIPGLRAVGMGEGNECPPESGRIPLRVVG